MKSQSVCEVTPRAVASEVKAGDNYRVIIIVLWQLYLYIII